MELFAQVNKLSNWNEREIMIPGLFIAVYSFTVFTVLIIRYLVFFCLFLNANCLFLSLEANIYECEALFLFLSSSRIV